MLSGSLDDVLDSVRALWSHGICTGSFSTLLVRRKFFCFQFESFSRMPFYAEAKVLFLLYLISSSTRGSTVIYRGWIHPALSSNEAEIDVAIEKVKLKSFQTAKGWIKTGIQRVGGFVTNQALNRGGGLVQQMQRSYSMVDLTEVGSQPTYSRSATIHNISEEEGIIENRAKNGN